MKYPYGKDFTHYFYPVDLDGNALDIAVTAPAIYIYRTRPTLDQARAGTGSPLETVITWSDVPGGKSIAFDAVDDPAPTQAEYEWPYYIAVNYYLTATEQKQTRIDEIILFKALAQTTSHGVTAEFIKKIYPAIPAYVTDSRIEDHTEIGLEVLKIDLEKSGFKWAQVPDARKYRLALAAKTVQLASESLRIEEGDKFDLFAKTMEALYAKSLSVSVPYDSDRDGVPDTKTEKAGYQIGIV